MNAYDNSCLNTRRHGAVSVQHTRESRERYYDNHPRRGGNNAPTTKPSRSITWWFSADSVDANRRKRCSRVDGDVDNFLFFRWNERIRIDNSRCRKKIDREWKNSYSARYYNSSIFGNISVEKNCVVLRGKFEKALISHSNRKKAL